VLRWSRRTELHDGSVPSSQHGINIVCSSILCCGPLSPRLPSDRKVGILDVGTVWSHALASLFEPTVRQARDSHDGCEQHQDVMTH